MASGKVAGASLSARLQCLRKAGKKSGRKRVRAAQDEMPSEWKKESGFVYSRITVHDMSSAIVHKVLAPVSLFLKGKQVKTEDLLFYDLETTGLSTGAGVVAFLAGFGKITEGSLTVKQYFLSDFPGEIEFLQAVLTELKPGTVLVSYNGRTFDRHLLESRFLMNGMRFPDIPEIDLLYAARRLWKEHLPDCTLSTVERRILGIQRTGDIPGRDIPDVYFSFLRLRKSAFLEKVFYHHRKDIVSLALLVQHIDGLLRTPLDCSGDNRFSLGRYLLSEGKKEGGLLLDEVWKEGGAFSLKAGRILSIFHKRAGRLDKAVAVWEKMWHIHHGYFEGIELAKYYEHTLKDYSKALEYAGTLLHTAVIRKDKKREYELLHRFKRLERKRDSSLSIIP